MDACQSRIQLVTEGEASLHYCIWNGLTMAVGVFLYKLLANSVAYDLDLS